MHTYEGKKKYRKIVEKRHINMELAAILVITHTWRTDNANGLLYHRAHRESCCLTLFSFFSLSLSFQFLGCLWNDTKKNKSAKTLWFVCMACARARIECKYETWNIQKCSFHFIESRYCTQNVHKFSQNNATITIADRTHSKIPKKSILFLQWAWHDHTFACTHFRIQLLVLLMEVSVDNDCHKTYWRFYEEKE